ncbi:MAG: hypothetical protein B7Y25_00095 [Alphaproteobacteria bacterium 16-39-46]|nr:MAG: hypothetical protein B7Y25_00095 [Alphaproteobacteria bacterium 16-39-46]OZA44542.1 MAG: hypothetical protein B7X84_00225 [Alphaproteobacteria bacterium 17-39-52]HQS83391.1 hypothetical protein [Alphaproteobacteria bacterium]HQS93078.1 hypothetical protein [Alphaproteobacteria bacterium]
MHLKTINVLLIFLTLFLLEISRSPVSGVPSHGLSRYGNLKYPPNFKNFDYVNPGAPKGGALCVAVLGIFDTLTRTHSGHTP